MLYMNKLHDATTPVFQNRLARRGIGILERREADELYNKIARNLPEQLQLN